MTSPNQKPAGSQRKGWKLVWIDEFDGPGIDRSKWDFDMGNGFFDYASHTWVPGWGVASRAAKSSRVASAETCSCN